MSATLFAVFRLYQLPPRRRMFGLLALRRLAQDRNLSELVRRIDRAFRHDEDVLGRQRRRRSRKKAVNPRPLDFEIDRLLGFIYRLLKHYAADSTNPELAASARALKDLLFPGGLRAHVQLPFVEAAEATNQVLEQLSEEQYQSVIAQIGLVPQCERLRALNDEFRNVLGASAVVEPYSDLKADIDRGQELYLGIVSWIVLHFEDDTATRDELLALILDQNTAMRDYRRYRRSVIARAGERAEADESAEADGLPAAL